MSKEYQNERDRSYATRLRNILRNVGLDIDDLRYIREEDFRKFRNAGGGLMVWMYHQGITFGTFSYEYYRKHRTAILAGDIEPAKALAEEPEWKIYRKDCAQSFAEILLRAKPDGDIQEIASRAYELANQLVYKFTKQSKYEYGK